MRFYQSETLYHYYSAFSLLFKVDAKLYNESIGVRLQLDTHVAESALESLCLSGPIEDFRVPESRCHHPVSHLSRVPFDWSYKRYDDCRDCRHDIFRKFHCWPCQQVAARRVSGPDLCYCTTEKQCFNCEQVMLFPFPLTLMHGFDDGESATECHRLESVHNAWPWQWWEKRWESLGLPHNAVIAREAWYSELMRSSRAI